MLFNSYTFWLFYAVVLVTYWLLGKRRPQNLLLLFASYVFYGAWDWRFLSLILLSTVVDFVSGKAIAQCDEAKSRRRWLTLSMVTNLGLLGTFKYYDFFARELGALLHGLGVGVSLPILQVALPVGISFYTFQTMSYTIDVYRGRARASESFLDFALFVCFFPQLVAGPIERYNALMPQVSSKRTIDPDGISEGVYHILIGMFKKVVIADNMARLADAVFFVPTASLSAPEVLMGVLAFTVQIYGDFSGYSSIAQGVARLLGFKLMYNFRMPYFARSPSDFWRRWHISLSRWLRDYLYISLGGNRGARWKTYRNLMVTMALGGLWHGAGWTFVGWGVFHGVILWLYRPFEGKGPPLRAGVLARFVGVVQVFLMFTLTCLGWLLFRAQSIGQVWEMLGRLFASWELTAMAVHGFGLIAFFGLPLFLYEWWVERRGNMTAILEVHWIFRSLVFGFMVWMLWFFPAETVHEFIYFQF